MRGWRCSAMIAGMAVFASAGTLTGRFVLPSLGPVVGGTLQLSLSQAGIAPGSYSIVPARVACYTTTNGAVVGVPDPVATPVGTAFAGMGTLPAGTYYVKIVYTASGSLSSLASPEAAFTLTSAGEITITAPTLQPAAATGYSVYMSTTPGTETLQGTVSGWASYTQSTALASGAALPSGNSTQCQPMFNDAIIPAYTYYAASLSDAAGNVEPGYPQSWYLEGSQVDVSTITPLAANPSVQFPYPILANPATTTAQSLNSGLAMNGNLITQAGNVGPGFFSAFWAGAAPAAGTTIGTWTPNTAVVVRRLDVFAQTAGSGGTTGVTVTVSDGTSTCSFSGLLVAAATSASNGFPAGACAFNALVPLTVKWAGDDHTGAPQNLSWSVEMTAR